MIVQAYYSSKSVFLQISHSPNPGGAALKNKPVQKYEILVQEDETGFVGIV